MNHEPGCSMPTPRRDNLGRMRCPTCKYLQAEPPTIAPPVRVTRTLTATGYACRVHHDQPVTWRGKGCASCANQARQAKQAKHTQTKETP